ncbi:MAG: hypothetical protein WAO52_05170 [Prolixibacteraceae bacterium]
MKQSLIFILILEILSVTQVFGQQITETSFAIGINKTNSPENHSYFRETPLTHLIFNITKSWNKDDHRLSFRKAMGFNLQYSKISLSSGGLGANWNQTGYINSLLANMSIQANYKINKNFSVNLGPAAEFLIAGFYHLQTNSSSIYMDPPYSTHKNETRLNRDYFKQPAFGIKFGVFETGLSEKTTIGLNLSYMWTKSERSNFYADTYTQLTFVIGFRKMNKIKSIKEELHLAE